jgi:hypothetical protein
MAMMGAREDQSALDRLLGVTGTITPTNPTVRQRAAGWVQDALEKITDRYRARKIAETVLGGPSSNLPMQMGLADPTIVGALFARQENPNNGPGMPSGLSHAATVWHGSPHKFEKFDASKIGTGEGAQAYGHGLYLAGSPEVAKQYAGDLAAARALRPIGNVDLATAYQNMPSDVPQSLLAARRDFRALNDMGELSLSDRRDFLEAVRNNIVGAQSGSLYKVDLPDTAIARMLDWDKPLSQQPAAVQQAFAKYGAADGMTGQQAYRAAHEAAIRAGRALPAAEKERQMVDQLRKSGIPGIRYLDQGSRGAGAGTSNYVVFPGEESLLKILERNGVPIK